MTKRRIWRKMVNLGFTKKKVKWALILAVAKWIVTIGLITVLVKLDKWKGIYGLIITVVVIGLFFLINRKKARP